MSDLPAAQRHALEAWAEQAIEAGWLPSDSCNSLKHSTVSAPQDLFKEEQRPLVAGLFGGTGVGKSTLLNRLAGEPVARASAERPTSRDITLYVHRSISVDNLPDSFPMERMRTSLHNNEHYKQVLFIDMPDFDSVEASNRDLVDLWLPHLDVVIYVVSPERYRDDQGWRLLLRHAHEHAWLFVMNHWDRAEAEQLDDFKQQLGAAGLREPMIFRTDSSQQKDAHSIPAHDLQSTDITRSSAADDDLDLLASTLKSLSDQSIIKNLEEHGILARLKTLKTIGDGWLEALGQQTIWQDMPGSWQSHWRRDTADLRESMQWKIQAQARQYVETEGFLSSLIKRKKTAAMPVQSETAFIDESLLVRLDNTLADFLNQQAQRHELAIGALKEAVAEPYSRCRRDLAARVDDSLQRSLASPGSQWHRRLYKAAGLLCALLPLAALGWISWRVVGGFAAGSSDPSAYLSSNFAINGAMLLGISWLIPAFAHHKLRPSREVAAAKGLEAGLADSLDWCESTVFESLEQLGTRSAALRDAYQQLWEHLPTHRSVDLSEQLQRLLTHDDEQTAVHRSLDVRANTHNSTDSAPVS
ncbi:MAG: GTPase [Granulosicoccus sp.]